MDENQDAWKSIFEAVRIDNEVFRKQLERMEAEDIAPDPESPLLQPIKDYAQ